MKVCISGVDFRIVFIKKKSTHVNGKEKINTECLILVEKNRVIGEGYAKLSYLDQYDKVKGKKVALTKALASMEYYFFDSGYTAFNKEKRRIVWEAFFKAFPKR